MRIKRYVVSSMQEAMHKIRQDLGEDAVILNTKEIKPQGWRSFIAKKKIEIVAAANGSKKESEFASVLSEAVSMNESGRDAAPASAVPFAGNAAAIHQELRQMKELIRQLHVNANHGKPMRLQRLEKHLHAQEFDSEWMQQLIEGASDYEEEHRAAQAAGRQLKQFLDERPASELSSNTRIAHFVGPTGVGKTTTIAKLAAEQVLKCGRRVGLITADTYRIAAVEQLRTYAELIDIPLKVVHTPSDLSEAVRDLEQQCDLILMDTAGRNFNNMMFVSEVNRMLRSDAGSETYLVLSLTSKYADMRRIAENFSKFHLDKVLFTKMDETRSFGSIFNLLSEFPLTPSYITNGQSVPDDIQVFDSDLIVSRVMEGWEDE